MMIILQLPSKSIEILNLKRVRNKIIEFEKECWRISYQDDKLYVVVDKGIVVLDLSGHILDLLPIYTQKKCLLLPPKTGYISQILQRLCSLHKSYRTGINYPRDVTPANDQDVFVVSKNDLSIIQQNGKESTILLRRTDGLLKPRAVYYNKDRRELLVWNEGNGHAALYKVSVA
ncbi:unnamed protein product [Mytilus edulis]|uniref:Uncharacterized protein n=1 Tax=Mytilus edulis TaxID=6550 RepID=A0A8S3V077_MYTED|nr:unnamed protein product [Mytilus edulis]